MLSTIIIAVSLLISVVFVNAKITTALGRYESFPSAEVEADLRDGLLTYVACYSLRDAKFSKKCKITHSALFGSNELSTCNIMLEGKADNKMNVRALNVDKAVISWYNQNDVGPPYFLRYTIISFQDCKADEIHINFEDPASVITNLQKYASTMLINDDDTFDVFFESAKLCGNKVCKVTFNTRGKRIKGPVPSFLLTESSLIKAEPKPLNGSFVITEVDVTGRIILVKPTGQQVLKEIKTKKDWPYNAVSTTGQVIRICSTTEKSSKIYCEVYDAVGQLQSKTTVDIGHEIKGVTIENLSGGEFIVLTSTNNINKIYFTKVDANGKRVGIIETERLICKDDGGSFKAGFEDDRPYCGSKLCYGNKSVELIKKCFRNEDFE